MTDSRRRTFLAVVAAGTTAAIAGCQDDQSSSTTATSDGADAPDTQRTTGATTEQSTEEPTETTTEDEPAGPAGSDEWRNVRGTPGNTGASTSGGPSADGTAVGTLEFEGGTAVGRHAPLVGSDGVYAAGKAARPYASDPPAFGLHAYRFDPADGSIDWRRTLVEGEGEAESNVVRRYRSSLGEDVVYVAWIGDLDDREYVEHLAALDRSDGSVRWQRTYEVSPRLTSPAAVDGTLYRVSSGKMQALDPADGSVRWQSDEYELYQWGHPAVGDDVVVEYTQSLREESYNRALVAFDRDTGETRWTAPVPRARQPEPTIHDGTVFVTEGDSIFQYGLSELEDAAPRHLYAFDASDGSERWSFQYDTDAMTDKVVVGGTSFVTVDADHAYIALGFATPEQIFGPNADGDEVESVRSKLYNGPNVFALARQSGDVAWNAQVGDLAQSVHPPIVDGDSLYVTRLAGDDQVRVHVLDRESGDSSGSFGPFARNADLGVADGALYAHGMDEISVWRDT